MSPKIVDREQRHTEILTAAFTLFVDKGYYKTTLGDIARAVGIGQGTLYYYFPTKDEIFWGVFDHMMSSIEKHMRQRLENQTSPMGRMEEFLNILLLNFPEVGISDTQISADFAQHQELANFSHVLMEFWLQAEHSGKQQQFYERIAQYQQQFVDDIALLLHALDITPPDGIEPKIVAHLLLALHDGLSMQFRMGVLQKDNHFLPQIVQFISTQLQNKNSHSP